MFRTLVIAVVWSCVVSASAHAFTPEQARALSVGDVDSRVSALQQVLKQPDDKAVAFLQALADDAVKMDGNHAVLMRDGKALDPVSGTEVTLSDSAEDVVNNNRMRGEIDDALSALQLLSPDVALRLKAAQNLLKQPDTSKLAMLNKALAQETDDAIKAVMQLARAAMLLNSEHVSERLNSA